MRGQVRRKLEMGGRVWEFGQARPSTDPSISTLLERVASQLTRADTVAKEERDGRLLARATVARRNELRQGIESRLLRHLVQVAEDASREDPDLVGMFRLRNPNSTHKSFLVSAKAMLAQALIRKEQFVRLGLSEAMLDELGRDLAEFEELGVRVMAARRSHVHARVELAELADDVVRLATRLDTLYRHRYLNDPATVAEWELVRAVQQGPLRRSTPQPAVGEVPPPIGGVAPAA